MLDYKALMLMAKKKAKKESEMLYQPWLHKERKKEYEQLTMKYYREYTVPPRKP